MLNIVYKGFDFKKITKMRKHKKNQQTIIHSKTPNFQSYISVSRTTRTRKILKIENQFF